MFKTKRNIVLAFGLCVVLLCVVGIANSRQEGAADPGVLPPQSNAYGKSCGEWQAEWIRWIFSFPADSNPTIDPDGTFTAQGQSGPVWFLANVGDLVGPGAPTDEVVTRACTVPAGKALFFPIVSFAFLLTPWDYNPDWVPGTPHLEDDLEWFLVNEGWIRVLVAGMVDSAYDLSCEIDGRPVGNIERYRGPQSPLFTFWLPEDNMFAYYYPQGVLPEGIYGPAFDEGYYLMLAPLPVGPHTIHFHATFVFPWPEPALRYEHVTWNLTVVPAGEAE